ncbi:hypothetical protein ACIOWF_06760 [Cellulosimicrobium cellulans]|uniref:hypothetical protein n=1 Tax=Cellulosimicrobium cellulans TaxID=1710 RepID=UPI00381EEB2D
MARTSSTPSQATPEPTTAPTAAAPEPAPNTTAPAAVDPAPAPPADAAPAAEESEQRKEYRGQVIDGGLVAYGPNTYSFADAVRLGLVPPQAGEPRL